QKGLVVREPNADDRRGVRVRLTAEGAGRVAAALADLLVFERRLLAGLDAAESGRLAGALRNLLVPFETR
ncbi:MAG TPA: MarR family transcriptional regulator, partial [Propionicimonas sp.]|nr:MarR family transcriptional regulator [Propionicimonas sp.]